MPVIEVTEEQSKFISLMVAAMKTQDNKQTSFPVYCIYDKFEDETIKFITFFFTEKAMNEHLADYADDFHNPFTHVRSMAYNEEVREVLKFLVSLDELVLPEHNNEAYE